MTSSVSIFWLVEDERALDEAQGGGADIDAVEMRTSRTLRVAVSCMMRRRRGSCSASLRHPALEPRVDAAERRRCGGSGAASNGCWRAGIAMNPIGQHAARRAKMMAVAQAADGFSRW